MWKFVPRPTRLWPSGRLGWTLLVVLAATLLATPSAGASEGSAASTTTPSTVDPADSLEGSLASDTLRHLVADVLAHNPDLAALKATAAGASERPARVSSLPDPMLGVTVFPQSPQTRVGPQTVGLSLSQRFPWFGKQDLQGRAAAADALSANARVRAARLALVTETRRLYYELAFVARSRDIVQEDRTTLVHYEELARSRYAAGKGLEQAVVKLQAEISKSEVRLLDLQTRQAGLLAEINALRDRTEGATVAVDSLPAFPQVELDAATLRSRALALRPEIAAARAQVSKGGILLDLSRKQNWPDFSLGLSYTFVGKRNDPAGLAAPPPDNGSDIIGISAGISLPLWRGAINAGENEAAQDRLAAEESYRATTTKINRSLDDLLRRVPLAWDRVRLYEDVLELQATQSLRSAESAYAATTAGALDLLDAERVLLEVRIAAARARTDYAIALAQLEGTVGAPISETSSQEGVK
ncbi:MAG TPA: TolC family protein [Candidatus Krumholzibacteria bacterium]|nr:TolC family protein [Candidatus Krumholzibacteria bacterium]